MPNEEDDVSVKADGNEGNIEEDSEKNKKNKFKNTCVKLFQLIEWSKEQEAKE